MDQVARELREPLEAKLAQQGMHSAAEGAGSDATIGGQNAAELERLIERVCPVNSASMNCYEHRCHLTRLQDTCRRSIISAMSAV